MVTNRRKFLKYAGVTAVGVGVAGCLGDGDDDSDADSDDSTGSPTDSDDQAGEVQTGGTLNYITPGGAQTLDTHSLTDSESGRVMRNVTEPLVRLNQEGTDIVPWLAEDWSVSDDGLEYTFELQEGVLFHPPVDRELRARDVVASFERIQEDPSFQGSQTQNEVSEFNAVDDLTVEMVFEEPFTPYLNQLIHYWQGILPHPDDYAFEEQSNQPVGTGPYTFDDREVDNFVQLTRFEDYWQEDYPYTDEIMASVVPEASVRVDSVTSGQSDLAYAIGTERVGSLQDNDDVEVPVWEGAGGCVMWQPNTEREPFDDPRAREAAFLAIDRQAIIDSILNGIGGNVTATRMEPSSPYSPDDIEAREQDIERAQELWNEAGIDDYEMEIKTVRGAGIPTQQYAVLIQDWLSDVGINSTITDLDAASWLEEVWTNRNHDSTIWPNSWTPEPHDALGNTHHSEGDYNLGNYANDEVDNLIDEARQAPRGEERVEMYHQAQQILYDEAGMAFLVQANDFAVRRAAVQNPQVWEGRFNRLWQNWIDE